MFPNEAQETMAKILFFVFATLMLCFGNVRASEHSIEPTSITHTL